MTMIGLLGSYYHDFNLNLMRKTHIQTNNDICKNLTGILERDLLKGEGMDS